MDVAALLQTSESFLLHLEQVYTRDRVSQILQAPAPASSSICYHSRPYSLFSWNTGFLVIPWIFKLIPTSGPLHWKPPPTNFPQIFVWLSLITLVLIKWSGPRPFWNTLSKGASTLSFLPRFLHSDGVFCQYLLICLLPICIEKGRPEVQRGWCPCLLCSALHPHVRGTR